MDKIPYFNASGHTQFIGGVMVPPGETREVDSRLIPVEASETKTEAPAAADKLTDIVSVLLAGSLDNLLAHLPALALEDLEKLGEAEQVGQQRPEVLGPVAEQILKLGEMPPEPEQGEAVDESSSEAVPEPARKKK